MKMKFYLKIFLIGMLTCFAFAACSKDDSVEKNGVGSGDLEVAPLSLDFTDFAAGEAELTIKTNIRWNVKSSAEWVTCSKYSGKGNETITVYVEESDQVSERKAELIVSANDKTITVSVIQLGKDPKMLVFLDGKEITTDTMHLDFESINYAISVLSNIPFEFNMDASASAWAQVREVGSMDAYEDYPKRRFIEMLVDDNRGDDRYSFFTFKHNGGVLKKQYVFHQEGYREYLRFYNQTVVMGSEFTYFNISGWGDASWKYEFINEEGKTCSAPDWIDESSLKVVGSKPAEANEIFRLGTDCCLEGDMEKNPSKEDRSCRIRFFYTSEGRAMENVITILQKGFNPLQSDSIALMRVVEVNAPDMGLKVDNWNSKDFSNWSNMGTDYVDGHLRVKQLFMGGTMMVGVLSSHIANLTELERIDISANRLKGSLPASLGRMKKLKYLIFNDNMNDGLLEGPLAGIEAIPEEIGGCEALEMISASANLLKGYPYSIKNLKNLKSLDLGSNPITDIPESLGELDQLEELDLTGIKYKGEFPEWVFNMKSLIYLSMMRCDFQGNELPDRFGELPNLQQLNLIQSNIGGKLPPSLAQCEELRSVSINGEGCTHKLTGQLPEEYGNLKHLQNMDFSEQDLEGPIPESYVNLFDLYYRDYTEFMTLSLYDNRLTTIPQKMVEHPVWNGAKIEVKDKNGQLVKRSIGNAQGERFIRPQRMSQN